MQIGKINTLQVVRFSSNGAYLADFDNFVGLADYRENITHKIPNNALAKSKKLDSDKFNNANNASVLYVGNRAYKEVLLPNKFVYKTSIDSNTPKPSVNIGDKIDVFYTLIR